MYMYLHPTCTVICQTHVNDCMLYLILPLGTAPMSLSTRALTVFAEIPGCSFSSPILWILLSMASLWLSEDSPFSGVPPSCFSLSEPWRACSNSSLGLRRCPWPSFWAWRTDLDEGGRWLDLGVEGAVGTAMVISPYSWAYRCSSASFWVVSQYLKYKSHRAPRSQGSLLFCALN